MIELLNSNNERAKKELLKMNIEESYESFFFREEMMEEIILIFLSFFQNKNYVINDINSSEFDKEIILKIELKNKQEKKINFFI
jgi:hypothetical protein